MKKEDKHVSDLGKDLERQSFAARYYNIQDFQRRDKTRFTKDSFIDEINFDYLEIQMLEED